MILAAALATRRNAVLVLVDACIWFAWSLASGYLAHRLPLARLQHDRGLLRLRRPERRVYERVCKVKRWKDWLPEAGDLFRGGFDKRHLKGRNLAALERFAAETRRAEITHWLILGAGPLFFLWNPWPLGLVMLAYAMIANVPCLVVQRYNRARLVRLIDTGASPSH